MSRLPDLVRDSKLETRFVPDFNVETVHTYHESERSRRRLVPVLEHWKRQEKIGGGGYSTVWLESCPKFSRHGVQVRAVKQIETGGRFARIDFNRELEAIAKFSHPKVCCITSALLKIELICIVRTMLRQIIRVVQYPRESLHFNGISAVGRST